VTDTESSERTPEFSLIVTTKDRTRELANLLRSLDCKRLRSFELIVSDQNADDRLLPVLAPFRQVNCYWITGIFRRFSNVSSQLGSIQG
jgi:hypothetical protein